MKKSACLVVIVVMIICSSILITSFLIWPFGQLQRQYSVYQIQVEDLNNSGNIQILVPLPRVEDDQVSSIVDDIEFYEGDGEFEIIETAHGSGLMITSNGSFKLVSENERKTDQHARNGEIERLIAAARQQIPGNQQQQRVSGELYGSEQSRHK